MKLQEKIQFHKPITTSREFFKDNIGVKCVHYGDIYKNYSGKTIPSSCIINNFANEVSSDKLLYCDSIIVPDVTETVSDWGHFTYIKYDGTPYINGTHAVALTCQSEDELKYIFRYLSSNYNRKRLQTLLNGSTVFQISIKDFGRFFLENYHESQAEQSHIVDILGTLDEKIENNEKNIALMLQLCKEKFSLLSSQSNIKTTLKNLCEFAICGTTPSTKAPELWNGNIPFITTPDMNNKVFVFDTERTVAYSDKIKSKLISEDSISVSCIGTIGVIGMATELSLTNQQINTLIPRTNQKYYLYNLLLANIDAIKAIATGSATPNISKESFLKLDVYVCSEKDICSFNEDVTPIYETIKKLQIENRKIKELKQLYLKKFFG